MSGIVDLRFDEPVAVIGDVHGRSDLLGRMLHILGAMPVLSVGDVLDRGPDAKGCIDLLLAHGAHGLLGNHEEWMRDWCAGEGFEPFALHAAMGGEATLRSYGVQGRSPAEIEGQLWRIPEAHRAWFTSLPDAFDLTVKGQTFWVIHSAPTLNDLVGGEAEFRELVEAEARRLRWSRYTVEGAGDAGRPVVAGHMVRAEPKRTARCIAIDTGCGTRPDGALTAVVLPEGRFISVR